MEPKSCGASAAKFAPASTNTFPFVEKYVFSPPE